MINNETLDRVFDQQRNMTDKAAELTSLESYLENLGIQSDEMMVWSMRYAAQNLRAGLESDDTTDEAALVSMVAGLFVRMFTMGLMIGREEGQSVTRNSWFSESDSDSDSDWKSDSDSD